MTLTTLVLILEGVHFLIEGFLFALVLVLIHRSTRIPTRLTRVRTTRATRAYFDTKAREQGLSPIPPRAHRRAS